MLPVRVLVRKDVASDGRARKGRIVREGHPARLAAQRPVVRPRVELFHRFGDPVGYRRVGHATQPTLTLEEVHAHLGTGWRVRRRHEPRATVVHVALGGRVAFAAAHPKVQHGRQRLQARLGHAVLVDGHVPVDPCVVLHAQLEETFGQGVAGQVNVLRERRFNAKVNVADHVPLARVGPRPHNEVGRRDTARLAPHSIVNLNGGPGVHVVPAREEKERHVHKAVNVCTDGHAGLLPKLVHLEAPGKVGHELFVGRRVAQGRTTLRKDGAVGQPADPVDGLEATGCLLWRVLAGPHPLTGLQRAAVSNARRERVKKAALDPKHALEEVLAGRSDGNGSLHVGKVGHTKGEHSARRPGLPGQPGDGGLPVRRLVHVLVEGAVRGEATSHILHEAGKAISGKEVSGVAQVGVRLALAVRCAKEHGGQRFRHQLGHLHGVGPASVRQRVLISLVVQSKCFFSVCVRRSGVQRKVQVTAKRDRTRRSVFVRHVDANVDKLDVRPVRSTRLSGTPKKGRHGDTMGWQVGAAVAV
mmetsp:Transcript_426/g.1290  ORF Transcript_426/g.1290 Transcript_426/m.1290 type:complete len:529 (+) Transcript_426:1033-2619(+)